MNSRDPKLTALQFNEYITNQDIKGLSGLMTEDHTFIDTEGNEHKGKECMTNCWIEFFKMFPDYRNTFSRVESKDDLVILFGIATSSDKTFDGSYIWRAKIEDDLVAEWCVYNDTAENRKTLDII